MEENGFGIKRVSLKREPDAVYDLYMGRANAWRNLDGSKWGNPFIMKNESDRARVLAEYREYVRNNKELYDSLEELIGKTLACWCDLSKTCHTDILIELLEEKEKLRDFSKRNPHHLGL